MQICRTNHVHDVLFMRELRRESSRARRMRQRCRTACWRALFWRAVRDLPSEGLSGEIRRLPQNEAMRERIGAAIEGTCREIQRCERLPAKLGISPRHLTGLCRRLFWRFPCAPALRLKLCRADEMLRYGDPAGERGQRRSRFRQSIPFFAGVSPALRPVSVAAVNRSKAREKRGKFAPISECRVGPCGRTVCARQAAVDKRRPYSRLHGSGLRLFQRFEPGGRGLPFGGGGVQAVHHASKFAG